MSEFTGSMSRVSTSEPIPSTCNSGVDAVIPASVSAESDMRTNQVVFKEDPGIDTQEMARFLGMVFGKTKDSYVQLCAFTYEGNDKPRVRHFVMNGELVDDKGETYAATPEIVASMVAQGDRDGILGPYAGRTNLENVSGWYIRMTTMAALPATQRERGGARLARQVIGFWADGDYGEKGHRRKKGELPNPPDADTVRSIWKRAGYPEPSVTWMTGGGINALWMFPEPVTIPDGPEGEEMYAKLSSASRRWGGHLARTARPMGYKHDTGGDLSRVLRLPGSVNRKADHAYDPKPVYAEYTGAVYELDELTSLLPEETRTAPRKATREYDGDGAAGATPWDAYNEYMWSEGRFRQKLAEDGWQHHGMSGLVENLTHPNKPSSEGQSATFGHNDDPGCPKLFNWSSSAPGLIGVDKEDDGCLERYVDPYTYLAATQFAYDEGTGALRTVKEALSFCARHLRSKGFGPSSKSTPVTEENDEDFMTDLQETVVIPQPRTGDIFDEDESDAVDSLDAAMEYVNVSDGEGGSVQRPTARAVAAQAARMGTQGPEQERDRILFRPASSYKAKRTEWLWDTTPEGAPPTSQGRIPRDMLTMGAGLPGTGKSQWCTWVTAQITRGTLPGCWFGKPMNVVYAATEDDWERTIRPRLEAAGADLDRVFDVRVRTIEHKTVKLTVPTYAHTFGEDAAKNDVALVVLDPLLSHIGVPKLNANAEKDIRDALEPLVKAAAKHGFTVIGLSHFNKNSHNADPMERLMGSRGFSALLRSLIVFAKDKDVDSDESHYVVSQAKNNLGRTDMPSYSYTIAGAVVETDEGDAYTSKFVLGGETTNSVEQVLQDAATGGGDRSERKEAEQWLYDYLTDPQNGGEGMPREIEKQAGASGISASALKAAKNKLGVKSVKSGGPGAPWVWRMKV